MKRFIINNLPKLLSFEEKAPDVALWHANFLNWYYLKKYMKYSANKYINGKCIDLGAGNSPYKKYIKEADYVAVDINGRCLDIKANLVYLPLKNNIADVVLLNQVLEHIYDYKTVLKEIKRILKKDGILILSVPFIYNIHFEPFDFFRFSEYALKKLLKENDYEIIEFRYCGYGGTAIISIVNNFLWQLFNKNNTLRVLRNTIFLIPIFIIFAINNIVGLLLDKLKNEKFCPNYFVICRCKK